MLSRQTLLKYSVKPAIRYFKVDKAASIHFACCQRRRVPLTILRSCNDPWKNVLGSGLFIRSESSSSSKGSIDALAGLDPIPEPPTPLAELAKSTVETLGFTGFQPSPSSNDYHVSAADTFTEGPEIYRLAMEVFSNLPHTEDQLGADAISHSIRNKAHGNDPTTTTNEILKAADEIWGIGPPPSESFHSSKNGSSDTSQLPYGSDSSTNDSRAESIFSKESEYTSIFDNIPDPPVVVSKLAEHIEAIATGAEPSLASLGLGGWWPTGIIQSSLELLHIDCALPWWGAVVCVTAVLRVLMFPLVVIAQRNGARLQNHMPQVQAIQLKITEAKQRGDKIDAARYSAELMEFMNKKNVNPLKNMIVPLCQMPVFLSMFWGLRSMANLPVESLKTGGCLWFVDLTVPDQFYLLPIITCTTLFLTIRLGVDGSAPTQNTAVAKYVLNALPIIVLPFIVSFPGLMLTYWSTSNFISLLQVGILKIPTVRDWCKIDRLVKHDRSLLPLENKSFVENIKGVWNNLKVSGELEQRAHADKANFMKAGRDPIRKTYKYDPTQKREPMTKLFKSDPTLSTKVMNSIQAKKRT